MIRTLAAFLLSAALSVSASAQPKEDWTLQQCIDYAIENNISVKQFQISSNNQELRLNTTRNNVRMAQNNIRIQELAITEAQLALRKEIEQSYYSADAAYQKYLSAEKSLAAAREAFRYQKEKADAGRSTIFDYNDAKTRMEKSESDMVQAKFNFIFSRKILDFYAGQPLDFSIY